MTKVSNPILRNRVENRRSNLQLNAGHPPAATIDHICEHSGITKGAFFHHFKTKEEVAKACLLAWDRRIAAMEEDAPFQRTADPRKRVLGYMEFFAGVFDDPKTPKSCLAGTTVQEVAHTNPVLRAAANACFQNAQKRFQVLLDDACKSSRRRVDTASLAALWSAAIQGSLILAKASRDSSVIRRNLDHVKDHIAGFLPAAKGSLMPCDERLVERVRSALSGWNGVTERRLFGGAAWLLRGNMCCGVTKDLLVLRLGPQEAESALRRPHIRRMDFTGKPVVPQFEHK